MTGVFTYISTFTLGLFHAFEPGHGKSILAAFTLRKTNFKIFSSLIFSLFISHFLVLGIFAFAIQSIASLAIVEEYTDHLKWITPVALMIYGGYLFYQARKHRKTATGCSCGHHHDSDEISNAKTASITGFIAGLMPCPTALAPLIIAGIHDGFSSNIVHILVYVTGMTLALFTFTALLLLMKSFFHKQISLMEGKINFNYLSALIMVALGVVYFAINMLSSETHHHLL